MTQRLPTWHEVDQQVSTVIRDATELRAAPTIERAYRLKTAAAVLAVYATELYQWAVSQLTPGIA